jgi:hypothetical protein
LLDISQIGKFVIYDKSGDQTTWLSELLGLAQHIRISLDELRSTLNA